MKKTILTTILAFLFFVSNAQVKIHSNGQVSFQSTTTHGGVQIDNEGKTSFEPNISHSYSIISQTVAMANLVKVWNVKHMGNPIPDPQDRFYVTGFGDAYAHAHYSISPGGGGNSKGRYPIENARQLLTSLNGYYYDNHDFEGFEPDFIDNPNVAPEAIDGLMKDLEVTKSLGLSVEELEAVLPEAIRHDPEGMVYINYSAVIPILVEAFKEQQAKLEQLEAVLKEYGLLKP